MNSINVIAPYKHLGTWVFDNAKVGLSQEPFVAGADTMIDRITANISNADSGFTLIFSASPFPGHQFRLDCRRSEDDGNGCLPRCCCISRRLRGRSMSRQVKPSRVAVLGSTARRQKRQALASIVGRNRRINKVASKCAQPCQGAVLVRSSQPTEPDNISRQIARRPAMPHMGRASAS